MLTLLTDCLLGDVPTDWQTKQLAKLLLANYPGNWGQDAGTNVVRVIRSTNLTNKGSLDFDDIAERHLDPDTATILEPKRGDILLERSGGGPGQPVGRVGFVEHDLPGFAFSNFLHLLRPNQEKINTRFLGWFLYKVNQSGRIIKLEQQTTQLRNLHFRDYLTQPIPLPPPQEQHAIAAILDAADADIERTGEVLSATAKLKRALMQQLLPPWIGFKRIADDALPMGVESHLAGKVCRIKNGSTPSRTEYLYWNKGTIPWLATGKVNDRIICNADEFVTEKALSECSIELLPAGSVLVGMIGQGRTRGMAAYLEMSACINQNFGAFVPGEKVVGKFLYHYLCFHYDRLRELGGGTNQGALNCYMLKRIRLALPKPEQQSEIARMLDACDFLAEKHERTIQVLRSLKRGLLQNFLTGKVRVPATLEVAR